MSSRKVRHNGQMRKASDIISRTKKYKYNKKGELVEYGGATAVTLADDEFKVAGSKSSLRRIADLERNVTLLITQINTTDGEDKDSDDDDFGTTVNKATRFKKSVRHSGNVSFDSGDTVTFNGDLVFGTNATADIRGLFSAGGDLSYSNGEFTFTQDHAWSSLTGKPTTLSALGVTDVYTKTQADSAISTAVNNVINGAPGALDTLNELAASLGDDSDFAGTVTNSLAGKVATNSAQALRASDALTVSNDTITLHKANGTSESVSISDANTDTLQSISATNSSSTFYPSFVSSTSGAQAGYVDTNMTYNPSTNTLSVANFNGTATYAKYADLAERYAADAPYAEGTVVVFGGEAEVTASTSFAQRSVAGVVSLRPAVAMNSEAGNNETHPYIALQGRVPVKVTGDVKKGDILVASDVAGTATAWTNDDADPRMTAYVGIAIADAVDGFVEVKVGK